MDVKQDPAVQQEQEQGKRIGKIVLEVKDLKTYVRTKRGVIPAVDGVSFYVKQGETFGIVGESGGGKSMTAKSILRMEPKPAASIEGGEILLDGVDLTKLSEKQMRKIRGREISMIFQDPMTSLNPVFTVGNQIGEGLRIYEGKMDKKTLKAKIIELLKKVNVAAPEKRISDYPHEMSGGMKQRAVGAIAISSSPKIIIADEPTTSLDLTIQAQYLRLLREIQEKSGVSIIFITHDFGIVAKMCDRVAVLYSGRIVEQGTVRALFKNPSHPYTHALINSVPKVEKRVDRLYSIPGQPTPAWERKKGCYFANRCEYAVDRCFEAYPPTFDGLSGTEGHLADCWRLEDKTWKPKPYLA